MRIDAPVLCYRKRILVFGDSNAFRPENDVTSWPILLANHYPNLVDVFNESIDGRTTQYGTGEYNGLSVVDKKLYAHLPLDYVVVMLGTNDIKNKYGPPDPADICEGMHQIVKKIDKYGGGAIPIILTPPPMGNVTSGELAGAQRRLPPVVKRFGCLAENYGISLVDLHSSLNLATDFLPDMIHLNESGRRKVSNLIYTNLQGKIVNDYRC